MRNTKLFQLLNTFSKQELEQFELFLKSPYFNAQDVFLRLFYILRPILIDTTIDKTDEVVFYELWPKKKYSKGHLSNHTSRFIKLAEQFLIMEASTKKEDEDQQLLLEVLLEKGLYKHFSSSYKHIEKSKQKEKLYINLYQKHFKHQYKLHEFKQLTHDKLDGKDFQAVLDNFDTHLLLSKLNLALEMIPLSLTFQANFRFSFMDKIEQLVSEIPFKNNILIQIYYQAYKIYKETNSDEDYYEFKKMIIKEKSKLEKRELKELLSHAINYTTIQISRGRSSFLAESLSVYRLMEEEEVLFQGKFNILSANTLNDYRNIISIACRNGDFEWVKDFIKRNRKVVNKKYREGTYNFGMGAYHFYQKDFDKAMEYFNKTYDVSDIDIYYEMNRRYVYIRCIYESEKEYKDDIEQAVQVLQINKAWFKKQKRIVAEQFSTAYAETTGILINLYRIKYNIYQSKTRRKNTLKRVKERMEKLPMVMGKDWYVEKIEELEKQLQGR